MRQWKPGSARLAVKRWALVLGLAVAAPVVAEPAAWVPRAAADKTRPGPAAGTRVERVVVKFHEGSQVRLRGGRLVALAAERGPRDAARLADRALTDRQLSEDLASTASLVARSRVSGPLGPLFRQDEAELAQARRQGEAEGRRELADLSLYFEVPLPAGTTAGQVRELVDGLNALPSVEVAYAEPVSEPAMVGFGSQLAPALLAATDLPPTTPNMQSEQSYLAAAPSGVDALYAWTVNGGNGRNVRIVDVEGGWRTTHEDMPAMFHAGGTQINDVGWRNHGTAVLGVMVGVSNAYGVTGISHAAQAGYESIGAQTAASAISKAATAAGRGNIVLIELHRLGPTNGQACTCNEPQCDYVAMEYWQAEYDAIATATANGVIVVEAAGNGSSNLDDAAYGGLFNRATRDSGAIVVAASQSSGRTPTCWTNWGSRIDVHGWGENVVTLGYGDRFGGTDENQWYTSFFSGTSSASPVVVGSVASIQGAVLASGRAALTPSAMRTLLGSTGTAQVTGSKRIGPLPDLRRALTSVLNTKQGTLWTTQYSNTAGWGTDASNWGTLRFPDLNGDGRADVCGRGGSGLICGLSTGTGFGTTTFWSTGFTNAEGWNTSTSFWQTIQFQDLNNDNLDDVCGRFSDGIRCALSTGTAFGPVSLWTTDYSNTGGWGNDAAFWGTVRFPDLNGDGRADVCGRGYGGLVCGLSTGTGFSAPGFWTSGPFGNVEGWAANASYWQTIQFQDLSGDGKDDVCGRFSDGVRCATSTGTAFGPVTLWTTDYSDGAGWGASTSLWQTLRFQDLDADGKADACGRATGGIFCVK